MAVFPKNINDLNKQSFGKDVTGKPARRVINSEFRTKKLVAKKTTITIAGERIQFPDEGNFFEIYHITDAGIIYLSNEDEIGAANDTSAPLIANQKYSVSIKRGDEPDIFGIVSSGTIDVFVIGKA